MSIGKTENGKYRVNCTVVKEGKSYRFTKTVSTLKQAKSAQDDFRYRVNHELVTHKVMPFNIYGQQFIDILRGITPRTRDSYQQKFNYISGIMTNPINKYKNTDIKKIMNNLTEQGLSPRSIKHIHSVVKRIFAQAVLDFNGVYQPCGRFKADTGLQVSINKENKALTMEEQNRFLTYLKAKKNDKFFTHQEYIFGLLAFSTGMRRGEMTALEWTDFDLDNKTLSITKSMTYTKGKEELSTPKTHAGIREIQLDDFLVSEIKAYKTFLVEWFLLNEKFKTGWFFPYLVDSDKNTPITSWSQRMKKVFKACDIANSLHGLRHTHASNLLMKGFPLIQVANRLGHADANITLGIYAHMIKQDQVDISDYLPTMDISNVKGS